MAWSLEIKEKLLMEASEYLWEHIQKTHLNVNGYLERGSIFPGDELENVFAFKTEVVPEDVVRIIMEIMTAKDYDVTEFTLKYRTVNTDEDTDIIHEYLFTLEEVQR